ncbi:hypothetical protein LSTR_LSTR010400 [Laodelphax striatellus]|uniref:DUF243 domain-containing protein n=1 Tax=Laodelphax striatellus TaxID=195883 RepID=A0A482WRW3_LAOST|nr:hypothetical protein LSTR_LSTR010400 [Laodelphax striatellus]
MFEVREVEERDCKWRRRRRRKQIRKKEEDKKRRKPQREEIRAAGEIREGTLSMLLTTTWAYPDAEGTLHHLGGGYGVTGGGAIGAHTGGAYLGAHGGGAGGAAPIVQKHIYVHVPPPDPDFQGPRQPVIPPPPPKKHYKIVFIKAPSYPQSLFSILCWRYRALHIFPKGRAVLEINDQQTRSSKSMALEVEHKRAK